MCFLLYVMRCYITPFNQPNVLSKRRRRKVDIKLYKTISNICSVHLKIESFKIQNLNVKNDFQLILQDD